MSPTSVPPPLALGTVASCATGPLAGSASITNGLNGVWAANTTWYPARPPERHDAADPVLLGGGVDRVGARADGAGRNSVHPDAVRAELARKLLDEHRHRRL